jgi:predicted MPP superfamily phosphohydrolase
MLKRVFFLGGFLLLLTLTFGEITRGPFLQPTEDLEHSVGIAWETDNKNGGIVSYGLEEVGENQIEGEYQGKSPRGKHRYYIKLTSLKPGKEYKYKVISDGTETPIYSFLTSSSSPDFSFRALVLSDTHFYEDLNKAKSYLEPFLSAMENFKPHLLLHTGDFPYGGKPKKHATDLEYQNGLTLLKEIVARAIFCPVAGNHDLSRPSSYDYRIFADEFYLPENGPEPVSRRDRYLKEANYSFGYGGIHFTTLGVGYLHFGNHNTDGKIRNPYRWLENDLKNALASGKVRNIIGRAHVVQPYSNRRGGKPSSRTREAIRYTNILDKYKVALVLAGHNHSFQRTYPIDHEGSTSSSLGRIVTREKQHYTVPRGVIYQTVSSTLYPYEVSDWSGYAFRASEKGYLTLEVSRGGAKIKLKAWKAGGKVIDECVIERNISNVEMGEVKEEGIHFLWSVYPNPFNAECYIPVNAKCKMQNAKCRIYNILGQLVREIECSGVNVQDSRVYWDGKDSGGLEVPAGVYFYEVAGETVRRMVVVR